MSGPSLSYAGENGGVDGMQYVAGEVHPTRMVIVAGIHGACIAALLGLARLVGFRDAQDPFFIRVQIGSLQGIQR